MLNKNTVLQHDYDEGCNSAAVSNNGPTRVSSHSRHIKTRGEMYVNTSDTHQAKVKNSLGLRSRLDGFVCDSVSRFLAYRAE